ncbi:MAG: flagellar M-ring protein FliF [Planctomycetes bacterium]|jgi:flagellar M-ring protein FliF|nr:flagellar M-ring protein FliF [Phycisphaerae bacterium]NBB95049.1 flagellar M-ring protein FliF [Planctomycetota bacterium]
MSNVVENLKQVWQQASWGHRLSLVGIAGGFIAVVLLLVFWSTRPEFALLYGNLSHEDAARVADHLREKNIPYELGDGGASVFVPDDQVYQLRLEIASGEMISGGNEGYKILDRDGLGVSPFKERVNYIRAVSGELEKTITLIDGVSSARVLVVSDQQRILGNSKQESSASVYIKTRGGQMTQRNVQAVASLVAGAVKGVSPEKVVVVVNGVQEHGQDTDELSGAPNSLLEYKMKIETYLGEKAEDMLSRVLGPNRATVKVNASLTTATISSSKKVVSPDERVVTREELQKKDVKSGTRTANNKPGGETKESTEKIDYLAGYEVEQRTDQPGKIESLAVSVFVDLSSLAGGDGGDGGEAPAAPALTIKQIKEAVRNALGLPDDSAITVVDVPFQDIATPEMDEPPLEIMGTILHYTREFSLGIAVVGMLLAFRLIRGKKPQGVVRREPAAEGSDSEHAAAAAGGRRKSAPSIKGPDRVLRGQIVNALTQSPGEVKKLFRSWVESESGE